MKTNKYTPSTSEWFKWMSQNNIQVTDFATVQIDGNGCYLSAHYSAELALQIQEVLGFHNVGEVDDEPVMLYWKRGLITIELFL